jgi:hypothetical protein
MHTMYILLCKETFQIRSHTCTLLTIIQSCTLTIHFCLWEIPCNYFPKYFSKERVYTSEGYQMFAFLSIDVKRDRAKLNRDIYFTCILHLLNNTRVKHNLKSVHASNLFWSRVQQCKGNMQIPIIFKSRG